MGLMMRVTFGVGGLAIAVCLLACAESQTGDLAGTWSATVDTVGDTVVVRTLAGSVWSDTAHLEPLVSIGVPDGPDQYLFGNPWALAVGTEGTLYVLDTQVPVVRAYGPDGVYLRNVGRKGRGPGEYWSPDGMTSLIDGRLAVRDPGNARIALFDADGGYLEQWWLPGGRSTSRRSYADTAGNSYATVWWQPHQSSEQRAGLARYSPMGEILDTVLAPDWEYVSPRVEAAREGIGRSTARVPFTPQPWWTFSPMGYAVGGLSTDYRIDLFHTDGSVLRIERDHVLVRVGREEADERVRRRTAQFRRDFGNWSWNGPPIPSTKPPFRNVFTSWDGNIWVLVSQPGHMTMTAAEARQEERVRGIPPLRFEEPAAFDVFSPDGRFLGHVKTPPAFRTRPEPIIRGDTVWAVARDELDVATIVRYRIVHP